MQVDSSSKIPTLFHTLDPRALVNLAKTNRFFRNAVYTYANQILSKFKLEPSKTPLLALERVHLTAFSKEPALKVGSPFQATCVEACKDYFFALNGDSCQVFERKSGKLSFEIKESRKLLPKFIFNRLLALDSSFIHLKTNEKIETTNPNINGLNSSWLITSGPAGTFYAYSIDDKVKKVATLKVPYKVNDIEVVGDWVNFVEHSLSFAHLTYNLRTSQSVYVYPSKSKRIIRWHAFRDQVDINESIDKTFNRTKFEGWSKTPPRSPFKKDLCKQEDQKQQLVIGTKEDRKVYKTTLNYSRVSEMFDDRLLSYSGNKLFVYDLHQNKILHRIPCIEITRFLSIWGSFVLFEARQNSSPPIRAYIMHLPSKSVVKEFDPSEWIALDFDLIFKREGNQLTRYTFPELYNGALKTK